MKAVWFDAPGGVEQLKITNIQAPQPKAGELALRVSYAGVNRPDLLQREGLYPPPVGASPILGLEVSGTVDELGSGCQGKFQKGDTVMALTNGGGYAEYVCVPEAQCMRIPTGLSLADAAAVPETYLTVWQNVFVQAKLVAGQSVLVHGGSSGIGSATIQLGRLLGLKVFVTVGDPAKAEFCLSLGAEKAYLYKEQDWSKALIEDTAGEGVDLVLDMVAGSYVDPGLKCLKHGGQYLIIALLGGRRAYIDAALLMTKQLHLTGNTLRPRSSEFKAALVDGLEPVLHRGFNSGALRPVVGRVFNMEQVAKAHSLMHSGQFLGKIVLKVCGD